MGLRNKRKKMKEKKQEEILILFQELLKNEINNSSSFFKRDIDYIVDKQKSKLLEDSYTSNIYNALQEISILDKKTTKNMNILLQFYSSEAFRYFFKHLEEGENIKQGERINFELTAVNENTGQKTKLISATPDEDEIDNDFQGWIMDNCAELKEK